MFGFQSSGYVIIGLMCLIACVILFLILQRIKNKSLKGEIKNFKKVSFIEIALGGILILISIVWFLHIQKEIDNTLSILQPVAVLTSEPVKLLAIALCLIGIISFIAGSYYLFKYKKSLSNESR